MTQPGATRPGGSVRSRPATSADVARRAEVSRSTVSQVLNGQVGRFSADTVDRVRNAAAELGYVRSAAGRALVTGRSDFIVLVAPDTTLTRLQDVVEVLAADIKELGFTVIVHFPPSEAERGLPSRLQHVVEALRPAGVVDLGGLSPADLDYLHAFGCPVVPEAVDDALNPYIGRLQAEHLAARGYREIAYAFLSDGRGDPFGHVRETGVAAVCGDRGLPPPAHVHLQLDAASAGCALEKLFAGRRQRVGIACQNDEVAIALLYAAERLGLAVPAEVGLVGVDRTNVGQLVTPRLTTVSADVAASLGFIRASIVQAYGGPAPREPIAAPKEIVSLTPGGTT